MAPPVAALYPQVMPNGFRTKYLQPLRLSIAILVVAPDAAVAQGQHALPPAARSAWGFDRSDLAPHPGVRFGVLPGGMRYALMRHASPAGGLSMRLHFASGASVEGQGQNGFMHVLEHLIFHGSANLPQGALLFMLPQAGMKRVSDFGAVTSPEGTVYRLDLTRGDARARATALTLASEIGRGLIFDRRTVAAAKAEVRAEIAARDGVADRMASARDAFFFPGSPIARGPVVGTQASVARATGAALRRLHAEHYVPARATLVMVGDFDPHTAEAEITARLASWRGGAGRVAAAPAIDYARGVEARLFVGRDAPTEVSIATVAPLGGADARGGRDAAFLQHLGAGMLGRRLGRGTTSAVYDHLGAGRLAVIDIPAPDRDWRGALAMGKAVLASVLDTGFTQAELDAQLAISRRALAPPAAPDSSTTLADAIADAVGRGILFTKPGDGSATDAYLARVRLADLNAAFRSAWAGPSRLIFVSHNLKFAGAEIAAAWTR